jgi:hypothetical protein
MDNWFEWQEYVNQRIGELVEFKNRRESDLSMANLRLQRLLDASIQRIGETEEECRRLRELLNDMPDTEKTEAGPMPSSSSVGISG